MNTYNNDSDMPNKPKRILIGLLILTLVDVIWASFPELDKLMNQKEKFEKPFFVTYVKTSLFTIYLFAVCLWPSWKDNFQKPSDYNINFSSATTSPKMLKMTYAYKARPTPSWGCFLTSSLMATVAISLTVPLCLLMDTFLFDLKHDSIVLIGIFPMFLFFGILVCLTLLPSLDPVLEVILKAWSMVCNSRSFKMSEYDLEQSESLIGVNDGDSHEA